MRRKLCNLQAASRNCSANLITIRLALRRPLQIKQPAFPAGNLHAFISQLRSPCRNAFQSVERRRIPRELRQKYRRPLDRPHCPPNAARLYPKPWLHSLFSLRDAANPGCALKLLAANANSSTIALLQTTVQQTTIPEPGLSQCQPPELDPVRADLCKIILRLLGKPAFSASSEHFGQSHGHFRGNSAPLVHQLRQRGAH